MIQEWINLTQVSNLVIKIAFCIVIFFLGRILIKTMQKFAQRSMERGGVEIGLTQFLNSFLRVAMYVILFLIMIGILGITPGAVIGALLSSGLAIGLALQGSLSNLAGGLTILFAKPFQVGDYIIEDTHKNEGTVKEIQIFYTKLLTIDNRTIIVPNGILVNASLVNVTDKEMRRLDLTVGISYESDLKKAKQLLQKILTADPQILSQKEQLVFVSQLGESEVLLGMRAWVRTEAFWETKCRLLEEIKLTFEQEKITIPYRQLVIHTEKK